MLPFSVQDRMPRLPSLRGASRAANAEPLMPQSRSVGSGLYRSRNHSSSQLPDPGTQTPPPTYAASKSLQDSVNASSTDANSVAYLLENDDPAWDESRPSTSSSSRSLLRHPESKTRIGWKFAHQGLSLLGLAVDESSSISHEAGEGNSAFARQLYVHSVSYLLRGLPPDLSTEEQLSLRSSLPSGVVEPLRLQVSEQQLIASRGGDVATADGSASSGSAPSFLHRVLASTIVQLFLFLQFIIPYIKVLLRMAYNYERQHHVSERVLATSMDTVDSLGRRGLGLGDAILRINDGKVGQLVSSLGTWCVDGLVGGIQDGVGEGMMMMSARKRAY
ncbi:MAG: hypothetical protein M1817_002044 [Caeruleum heppii]|nr:MAG: hypothetical protein M1817_002044 [Caeruleum heppii]